MPSGTYVERAYFQDRREVGSFKIDSHMLYGSVKRHAQNLNCISDGMQKAVEERLKSERFKTELITNRCTIFWMLRKWHLKKKTTRNGR